MKRIKKFIVFIIVIILAVTLFMKVNTDIYISREICIVDLTLYIDNDLIFEDSIFSPTFLPTKITKKLRYGFHDIELISNKANIRQKSKLLVLPSQYINIEFFGADTLCFPKREVLDTMELEEDSLFKEIRLNAKPYPEQSRFLVESMFNPFYTE